MPTIISGDGTITGLTSTGISAVQKLPAGTVLQVVQAETSTTTSTTSSSFVTANLTASITPTSSSSKVFVIVTGSGFIDGTNTSGIFTIFRGTVAGTNLGNATWGFMNFYGSASTVAGSLAMSYLDSPATTSSQTYTVAMRCEATTVKINPNGQKSTITLVEIAG